tara:strand:+ start:695 stop:1645 length:951 start_codon:yes stop_codon:yes gene_type:complete
MKKILLTGGCGYVGTVLTEYLAKKSYDITIIDNQWFGNHVKQRNNVKIIKDDIRNILNINLEPINTIIHLANIANDPGVELNPGLSWEVNVLATKQLADRAIDLGVKQFIYASSGSVYGIKDELKVTENLSTNPISIYNKTKIIAEKVLMSYRDQFQVHNIRPATVCGISPRMRLDVSVNMLTMQALTKNEINVLGGSQTRPNIHILDMVRVYEHFLENIGIESGAYNAGFENISILDIAKTVQKLIETKISIKESNDPRSYRQDSTKLIKTGFIPEHDITEAISEIKKNFEDGNLRDKEEYYTVKWMKKLKLDKK